jgi:hypothetical protein
LKGLFVEQNPIFNPVEFDGFRKQAGLNNLQEEGLKKLIFLGEDTGTDKSERFGLDISPRQKFSKI